MIISCHVNFFSVLALRGFKDIHLEESTADVVEVFLLVTESDTRIRDE